jgi:hypothetical protein
MKVIIIPQNQKAFYDKKFDSFNAIRPIELGNGDYFLTENIIPMLQSYVDGNYPQSIKAAASYTIAELQEFELREITESDLKSGELPEEVELFPYPDLNIRVFIEHKNITAMYESEARPLLEYALNCTKVKDSIGYTIWLSTLANPQMTAEAVRGILESFGAQILTK